MCLIRVGPELTTNILIMRSIWTQRYAEGRQHEDSEVGSLPNSGDRNWSDVTISL